MLIPARSRLVAVVAALACGSLLALATAADARTEPLTMHYSGTFTPPTVVSTQPLIIFTTDHLTGDGSPLGPFTGVYPHFGNFDTNTFSGIAVFTAGDGSSLVVNLGGSGTPTSPTTYAVTFAGTILGGTGRFEGASGSFGGPGTVNLADLTVAATLAGTIKSRG